MDRFAAPIPGDVALAVEPYGGDGARWVVEQAEAEIVERYGFLDSGERGLTAAMFDLPGRGPSWWPAVAMPPDRLPAGSGCAPSTPASARSAACGSTPRGAATRSPGRS